MSWRLKSFDSSLQSERGAANTPLVAVEHLLLRVHVVLGQRDERDDGLHLLLRYVHFEDAKSPCFALGVDEIFDALLQLVSGLFGVAFDVWNAAYEDVVVPARV